MGHTPGPDDAAAGQTVSARGCAGVSTPYSRPAGLDGYQTAGTARAPVCPARGDGAAGRTRHAPLQTDVT